MAANQRFSKGGSSAFLKTVRAEGRSPKRGLDELAALMSELVNGPVLLSQLSVRFPSAERIVRKLVLDGMVGHDQSDDSVSLTEDGKGFLKRRSLYTSKF